MLAVGLLVGFLVLLLGCCRALSGLFNLGVLDVGLLLLFAAGLLGWWAGGLFDDNWVLFLLLGLMFVIGLSCSWVAGLLSCWAVVAFGCWAGAVVGLVGYWANGWAGFLSCWAVGLGCWAGAVRLAGFRV